jgi:lactoylglutathione lyase
MHVLHTMLRVGDLERSIAFYREVLGMELLSRKDYPDGKFTLAFVGYGKNPEHAEIELTHNWGVESYELGSAYGHIALGVDDLDETLAALKKQGIEPEREPYRVRDGGSRLCFVRDPDSYRIELIDLSRR